MTDFIRIAQILRYFKTGSWPSAAWLVSEALGVKKEAANVVYYNYRHGRRSLKLDEAGKLAKLGGFPVEWMTAPEAVNIRKEVAKRLACDEI